MLLDLSASRLQDLFVREVRLNDQYCQVFTETFHSTVLSRWISEAYEQILFLHQHVLFVKFSPELSVNKGSDEGVNLDNFTP